MPDEKGNDVKKNDLYKVESALIVRQKLIFCPGSPGEGGGGLSARDLQWRQAHHQEEE